MGFRSKPSTSQRKRRHRMCLHPSPPMHCSGKLCIRASRMEVPCCGGLEMAAKKALQTSGKFIPWQVVTISIDGKILD